MQHPVRLRLRWARPLGAVCVLTAAVWAQPYQIETVEGYLATAPNGNALWVKVIQPRDELYPGQRFPAIINVPGGLGAGEGGNVNLAALGFVEIHFNAEGRGVQHPSEGAEDYNGFLHQDDLRSVIEFALAQQNVATDNVGVATNSYGITMGTGCLGRYPTLPVKYLVDNEGPSESFNTCFETWSLDDNPANDRINQGYAVFGHFSICRDSSAANQSWWSEREAVRFIGNMRCRYVRVQAEWDHAQPPNAQWPGFDYPPLWYPGKHGIDLVNLATHGNSAWTRVNGLPLGNTPNTLYSREHPPVFYSGTFQTHPGELQMIIREMANLPWVVSHLVITPILPEDVRLHWQPLPLASQYHVYGNATPFFTPPGQGVLLGSSNDTSYVITGAIPANDRWFFRVVYSQ